MTNMMSLYKKKIVNHMWDKNKLLQIEIIRQEVVFIQKRTKISQSCMTANLGKNMSPTIYVQNHITSTTESKFQKENSSIQEKTI